jgi:hypothetical protein
MVYDITLVCQQTLSFFGCFLVGFRLKLKSVAQMALNRQCLLQDEIEQSLLEQLTASDKSSCSEDADSSGTDILTIVEVTGSECSDSENEDIQYATASSKPTA